MAIPALYTVGEEDLILRYFKDDYTHEDICKFLHLRHGINLTIDHIENFCVFLKQLIFSVKCVLP